MRSALCKPIHSYSCCEIFPPFKSGRASSPFTFQTRPPFLTPRSQCTSPFASTRFILILHLLFFLLTLVFRVAKAASHTNPLNYPEHQASHRIKNITVDDMIFIEYLYITLREEDITLTIYVKLACSTLQYAPSPKRIRAIQAQIRIDR